MELPRFAATNLLNHLYQLLVAVLPAPTWNLMLHVNSLEEFLKSQMTSKNTAFL